MANKVIGVLGVLATLVFLACPWVGVAGPDDITGMGALVWDGIILVFATVGVAAWADLND